MAEDAKAPNTAASAAAPAQAPPPASGSAAAAKPPPKPNPAFRAMGLPNFRIKLPSRNWMIFLSITGSWTAAVLYDRRQKRNVQRKWCELVSHIKEEPLETNTLPRRVTIFLSAPPGDGLRVAREHFTEYVKPILVAAALDWDVVEGRKEGEVRAALAERIRRQRRRQGDVAETPLEEDSALALQRIRDRIGVQEYSGTKGDIVIGRNTWKEYVRGLHEGWLGPMDEKKPAPVVQGLDDVLAMTASDSETLPSSQGEILDSSSSPSAPDASAVVDEFLKESSSTANTDKSTTPEPSKPEKPPVPLPYNTITSYPDSRLPRFAPEELGPSAPIQFPHILGFFNTPIRMYRFLNRRTVADDIGRQTAAAVLAAHRAYDQNDANSSFSSSPTLNDDNDQLTPSSSTSQNQYEQQRILAHEEADWTKTSKKREADDPSERVRLDDVVVDARIGARMRRFVLEQQMEQRAVDIEAGLSGWMHDLWRALRSA